MKRYFLIAAGCLLMTCPASAQEELRTWEQTWHEVMSAEEQEDESWEETFEILEQLATTPMDINRATREELEQLPFLSQQQVMDLREYLDRYGPMRSLGELRMIGSLDYRQLQLLPFFVFVGEEREKGKQLPSIGSVAKYGRHELTGSLHIPFYHRKGDVNGYLGYRYRHELRYEFSYGNRIRAGLVGAQDAGEPFFANNNRWGYDAYSYYAQVKDWGMMENIVVGKYKLSMGKGLVMGSSFTAGKLASLQSLGRTPTMLRPHASRSEADYLQGMAATLRLSHDWRLTTFVSHRSLDATLDSRGQAQTLVTTGYHRTLKEMEKKYNTHETDAGTRLELRRGAFRTGLTAIYTHLDRRLQPETETLYRRYQASGNDFTNFSIDYSYTLHRLSLSGETASNRNGHLATYNVLNYQPSDKWALMALQRFYSYRYHALHAHAQSEGGHVQNESGVLLGATWTPLRHWHLQAYADYAYFPWARYRVSQSSEAIDLLLASTLEWKPWTLKARYRRHLRQRDNEEKTALVNQTEHRARLSLTYAPPTSAWILTTQGDYTHTNGNGWMVSEMASWQHRFGLLAATAAWFYTDGYDNRLYLYERQLPHHFSFPFYYGKGLRLSLMTRTNWGHWQGNLRLGYTRYFDRTTIGSGWQQINQSSLTDMEVQLRYRF